MQRLTGDRSERDAAIAELRELILRGLSRSLTNRYGNAFQAEDVVQEAMLKILNSLEKFEGRCRFTTWAMTIAMRVGISELRRRHVQHVSLDSISAGDSLRIELAVDKNSPADEQLDHDAIIQKLRDLIETRLTDKQKRAVRALLEGLPIEEIARRTSSNRNAVYKLVHDARMRLREGFKLAGIVADDISVV